MKWRVRKPGARFRAKKWWHVWFAWHPVRVPTKGKFSGMTMVWFEKVARRGKFRCWGLTECSWEWEYVRI